LPKNVIFSKILDTINHDSNKKIIANPTKITEPKKMYIVRNGERKSIVLNNTPNDHELLNDHNISTRLIDNEAHIHASNLSNNYLISQDQLPKNSDLINSIMPKIESSLNIFNDETLDGMQEYLLSRTILNTIKFDFHLDQYFTLKINIQFYIKVINYIFIIIINLSLLL
jgi:hypothetical protein